MREILPLQDLPSIRSFINSSILSFFLSSWHIVESARVKLEIGAPPFVRYSRITLQHSLLPPGDYDGEKPFSNCLHRSVELVALPRHREQSVALARPTSSASSGFFI